SPRRPGAWSHGRRRLGALGEFLGARRGDSVQRTAMEHRLALGEALSAGCAAPPLARVVHFPSVRDLPAAIVLPPVFSNKDGAVRWREGERLHHLMEQACQRFGANDAVVTDQTVMTYRELDKRANRVARYLIDQGIEPGDRVGLLFDKSVETYVALLAVMKVNAAYVPLDPGFPTERMGFILADASIRSVVSMSSFGARLGAFDVRHVLLDTAKQAIDAKPDTPLAEHEVGPAVDRICYIIYTSGTTGKPKGVVVEHPSICNFVRVASERYGFAPGDRVYQGMTIAFDFSVEEIWVPLMAGAPLVPATPGVTLLADKLADFLKDRRVTCLCCCPPLLATIETRVALISMQPRL